MGVYVNGHLVVSFLRSKMYAEEWVAGGGGLDGYFGEQGLPVGILEYLERFHRGCVGYLSRHLR